MAVFKIFSFGSVLFPMYLKDSPRQVQNIYFEYLIQYGQGHTMINHRDGHKINSSVGISLTFSHCDRPWKMVIKISEKD